MTLDDPAIPPGVTVVTGTERLARVLVRAHDAASRATGATAWPAADVLPLAAFLERLATGGDAAGAELPADLPPPEVTRLLWREALADAGPGAAALAGAAARTWHVASLHGLREPDLRAAIDSADAEAFHGWVVRYLAALDAAGYADLHEVAAAIAVGRRAVAATAMPRALRVAGLDPLPPLYRAVLERLAGLGVAVSAVAPPALAGRREARSAPDALAEIRAAASFARARLDANPAARVGIVVTDLAARGASVRRALLDVLDPAWRTAPAAGQRLAVSLGRPLAAYPVIHAALAWLEGVTRPVPWAVASALLRSPFLGAPGETAGRALAELALRDAGSTVFTGRDLLLVLRPRAPGSAAQLEAALDLVATARAAPPSLGVALLGRLLVLGGWPGEAPAAPTTVQAGAAFRRLQASLAGTDRVVGSATAMRLVDLLGAFAREQAFEPEGEIAPVQVLGALEAEGQVFDHLWITGVSARDWPPAPRPLPFLPLHLQRSAGIPDATPASVQALWTRRFERLLAAAPEVVASFSARDGEEELLPSPVLSGLPAGPRIEADAAATTPARHAVAQAAVPLEARSDPAPAFAGERVRGGVRVLSLQATSPAAAFATARLHVRPLPPPPLPLTDADRGRTVHALLQALYDQPECTGGLGSLAPAALRAAFLAVADDVLTARIPGTDTLARAWRALERERLWAQVERLALFDGGRGPFTVATEVVRQIAFAGLMFDVRLDRVEQHPDGELVLDYKTGSVRVRDWYPPRPADAQLPVYALTGGARGVGVVGLRAGGLEVRGISDVPLAAGLKSPDRLRGLGIADWPTLVAAWEAALTTLAGEFRNGDFRLDRRARYRADDQWPLLTRAHELTGSPDELDVAEDAEEGP